MPNAPSVDDLVTALRRLFRALIDAEGRSWEREKEPFASPGARIAFITRDQRTAWLSPLTRLLAASDAFCRDHGDDVDDTARVIARETRQLLGERRLANPEFRQRLADWCATDPQVASAHATVARLVHPTSMGDASSQELHERHVRAMKQEHGAGD